MLIYDIEIKNAIPPKDGALDPEVAYCAGWGDHANMGIACIGCYDYVEDRYRVFMDDNLLDFYALACVRSPLVGFNNIAFDDAVIRATAGELYPGDDVAHRYDILVQLWEAAGLGPKFQYPSHMGFSLDAVSKANFGAAKSGNGALAPVDFQRRRYGALIDYCLNDVRLTKRALDWILTHGWLADPREPTRRLHVRRPV